MIQKQGNFDKPKISLPVLILDYTKDVELFNETAKKVANLIAQNRRPETKATQMRNFYDYVLDLYTQSKNKPFNEVLPFVKMINSKVAYAKSRNHVNDEFVEMIKICVNQISTQKQLEIFKLFFEAVIGFSKK
jgi:CRISPR-associated protein Csm2